MNIELRHPLSETRRTREAGGDRLRHPSQGDARGDAPVPVEPLVGLSADLRGALASRLRQGLSVPEGHAAGGAARRLAARRRASGQRPRSHARAASRPLRHRLRRDEPALAFRPGRAEPGTLRRARLRRQRLADRRAERARAAPQGLDRGALRGRRGRPRRDSQARARAATTCRCSCSAVPPRRSAAGATGRSTRPRSRTGSRSAFTCSATAAWRSPTTGWPSFYIEETTENATSSQAIVTSFIMEGVLARYPGLKDRADRNRLRLAAGARLAPRQDLEAAQG